MVLRLVLAAALWSACVPDTEELEVDVYEICYHGLDATVSRVSEATARGVVTVDDIDFGRATLDDPQIGLRTLRVEVAEGLSDFEFAEAAYIDVADERVLELSAGGVSLYGEQSSPSDLLQHIVDDALELTLTVEGEIPAATWRVSIDACFDIEGIRVGR